MEQQLRDDGYWATSHILDADEYGSPVPRIRAWWGGLQGIPVQGRKASEADFFCSRLLRAFKLPAQTDMTEVIEMNSATRRAICNHIGVSSLEHTGIRESRSTEKNGGDQKWKEYHAELYQNVLGLVWPVVHSMLAAEICIDGLARREADAAYFLHKAFPRQHEMEFLNINPDILMILNGCLEWSAVEGGQPTFAIKKSPWKKKPGTLIGSCKLLCRYVAEGKEVVRAWEAFEYMAAIGWHPESWQKEGMTPKMVPLETQDVVETVSCLAGNAFCLYHFVPFELALLATYGKFAWDVAKEDEEVIEEDEEATISDGSSSDAD